MNEIKYEAKFYNTKWFHFNSNNNNNNNYK